MFPYVEYLEGKKFEKDFYEFSALSPRSCSKCCSCVGYKHNKITKYYINFLNKYSRNI